MSVYLLTDVEACEPSELPWQAGIHIRFSHYSTTSSGCARLDLCADDRRALLDYVRANWGDDDGDWYAEQVSRVETMPADFLKGEYVVTETPDDPSLNPLWVGEADSPIDALDRFAVDAGFVPYTVICGEEGRLGGLHEDEQNGWLFNYETGSTVCLGAIFTNTQVFALPVKS